ncbi:hypothetical protein LWP59_07260 [Amycolatopsis acidiphila]|uniref:Uncharacterized protein n=1 Tax=Amycolatopsis acidiphila TaxID=715473 RepID=A0A558A8K6_9PSEU|nr:hypothetical protein [Amycolatopsis acidiphila]TVT20587.1 hypothetical protein FNH06_19840 [Amycolatopsis acidiphila]UIJ61418.1 hypothetical protein LWP59_07260 [Amycolatopsis acidiphila]GHG77797.1 hypothetical protein GCM10017788_44150 [Amycolatopsis acidiphila]
MRWFRRTAREDEVPDPRTPWPAQDVPDDPAAAAIAFWRHWFELLPEINAALGDREPQRVEHELAGAVARLHPDLHFSLERGRHAIYALVVTGQEDPALRPYTDAWREAAPEEDAIWEYHDSVPPVPDPSGVTVNLGEQRISLGEFRVGAQVEDGRVDVTVFHPKLAELDEASRAAMTFLPLDATLGERLAGERLRRVEAVEAEPAGSMSLLQLRDLVRGLGGENAENVGGPD